jgi:hypothetical protein
LRPISIDPKGSNCNIFRNVVLDSPLRQGKTRKPEVILWVINFEFATYNYQYCGT